MTASQLLIVAALVASCALFTDAVRLDKQKDEGSRLQSEEAESYMSILCTPMPAPSSRSSSVHSLRPVDVSAVYALGIPSSHRNEAPRLVSRIAELLSMFNADMTAPHVDESSLKPRSLLEEAEDLSLSFSHELTEWKLVLLFVPGGSLCACSPNVAADVNAVIQEVEAALQLLQTRMHHTLVHVVVWSSDQEKDNCECMRDESINKRLHKATLLKTLQDSLSLALENPEFLGTDKREDFSAVLQSAPLILEGGSKSESTGYDMNQLALQLWTNLLQPMTDRAEFSSFPCPTQERPFLRTHKNSVSEFEERASSPTDTDMGTEIPCKDRNPSPATPTSVHELRPGDIKVVAALGDSITAANGVGAKTNNLLLVINEYRGLSWSIGGDEDITNVTTLPNILKEFNPLLTGYSVGVGKQTTHDAFLNQAVAGAKSGDMVQHVRVLVDKMKNDPRIDFQNDWKVITMFVGGNDLCDYCTDTLFFSPRNVVGRIRDALDILHLEVPRAIVNLVELLNAIPLRDLHSDKTLGCPTWFVSLVCPCILKPKEGSIELQRVKDQNKAYQLAMRELVDTGRYDTHNNFTVVLQPFIREVFLPYEDGRPDRTYFSPDCFHLSQKAHTLMARALWNNMLEEVGNKTFTQNFTAGIELKCPSETNPFIRTALNSNYTFPGLPPTPAPATNWGSDFSCPNTAPSNSVPTSAQRLRPADFKVVAALGDSLTTGFGAKADFLPMLRTEYRGVSWSIGGDETLETVTTLPNILRKFNPDIKGMSKGITKEQAGFNVAVAGAKVSQIPEQVRRLIDILKKNDSAVDFEKDWKLVTLFIGGNDLCQYCNDRATFSPRNYSNHMMASLDLLYKEVPRVFVNVLGILEIEGLRRIKRDTIGCNVVQQFVCPCFLLPGEDSPELAEVKRINRELQTETENLVYGGRYDGREDFAVVMQPFFTNTIVPLNADGKPDDSYFSADCFHFSEQGHAEMAAALWNNMLEPVGEKMNYNHFTMSRNRINCPTEERPYIFTRVNSLPSLPPTTTAPTTSSTVTTTPAPTTTAPTTTTTAKPSNSRCTNTVPVWVPAVLAVVGLLIGCAGTWFLLSCRAKRRKTMMSVATGVELKGSAF